MNLQHFLSLALVLHSDRLLFVNLFVFSYNIYRCRPLARLHSIFVPQECSYRDRIIPIVSSLFMPPLLFTFPAFPQPRNLIVFVSMMFELFFNTSTSSKPRFNFLNGCSLSRFLRNNQRFIRELFLLIF